MKNEKWCGPLAKLRLVNLKTWPPFLMKNEKCQMKNGVGH